MSIVTRTGDTGTTGLMYSRRVPKNHPRIEACGCVDELNAALGLAKAGSVSAPMQELITAIQNDLIGLMGEMATAVEDLPRYLADGFQQVSADAVARLEAHIAKIEAEKVGRGDWAVPGATATSAALDLARTICRRAERRICELSEAGQIQNAQILIYMNRLSDLLWLLARQIEANKTH